MFSHENLTTDEEMQESGAGITLEMVAQAVCTWVAMQETGFTVSVLEAAKAFNTTASLICDAVQLDPYALLQPEFEPDPTKQFIELDGL
jgi:hypothetical protein